MGYWIPKWVSMTITFLQISQMILAVGLNLYAIYVKSRAFKVFNNLIKLLMNIKT